MPRYAHHPHRHARTHTRTRELPAAPASAATRQWHQRPDMIRAITHAHREQRARELGTVCVWFLSLCLSLSVSLSLSVCLSLSFFLSLFLSLSFCACVSISPSSSLSLSCFSLSIYLSIILSLSLYVCFSLVVHVRTCACMHVRMYARIGTHTHTHTHSLSLSLTLYPPTPPPTHPSHRKSPSKLLRSHRRRLHWCARDQLDQNELPKEHLARQGMEAAAVPTPSKTVSVRVCLRACAHTRACRTAR